MARDGLTIEKLNVMISMGNDQYLAQEFQQLDIKENKFSYHVSGNYYLGLPEINLQGEFVSKNLAKGTFNDMDWTAQPE